MPIDTVYMFAQVQILSEQMPLMQHINHYSPVYQHRTHEYREQQDNNASNKIIIKKYLGYPYKHKYWLIFDIRTLCYKRINVL